MRTTFASVRTLLLLILCGMILLFATGIQPPTIHAAEPTPTAQPPEFLLKALPYYGLNFVDVPVGFEMSGNNATQLLDDWQTALNKDFPKKAAIIKAAYTIYKNYGVAALSEANFLTSCKDQPIFGLSSWIRVTKDQKSADKMVKDSRLNGAYLTLFGWNPSEAKGLPGQLYESDVDSAQCSTPSKHYVMDFASDRYAIAVGVYALNSVDLTQVQNTLKNLAVLISQRTLPRNLIASASASSASTTGTASNAGNASSSAASNAGGTTTNPAVTNADGLISFAMPDNPGSLNSSFAWSPGTSDESNYDLISLPGTLHVIAGPGTSQWDDDTSAPSMALPFKGNFEAIVKVDTTLLEKYQGVSLGIRSQKDPTQWIRITRSIADNGQEIAVHFDKKGKSGVAEPKSLNANTFYLKMIRQGNYFSFYFSLDLKAWKTLVKNFSLQMEPTADIYLNVYSTPGKPVEARFSEFSVKAKK